MSFTLRRFAGTAALAVTASALTLPLAAPAHATTPTETQFFISDKVADANGDYGLYRRATPTGAATLLVGDTATTDVTELTGSHDGSRFIEVENTYNSSGDPVRTRVVVYDVGGRRVTVLQDLDANAYFQTTPALDWGGGTATWTVINGTTGAATQYQTNVGSGVPAARRSGVVGAVFVTSTTQIFQSATTGAWDYDNNGTVVAVPAIPSAASDVALSPDGSTLAWSLSTSSTTSSIQVAPLSFPSGVITVGSATTVATGNDNYSPSFSQDNLSVNFVKYNGTSGALYTTPANGSGTTGTAVDSTSVGDVDGQAIGTTDDGTAPGAPTANPAILKGSSATVAWVLAGDGDQSGVIIARKLGSTVQKAVYVPSPATSYVDTGLTVGATYTYDIQTVDRSGNLSTAATRQLSALQALPTFADPTSTTSAKTSFPVSFGPSSSGRFTVDYLVAGTTTWHRWVTNTAGKTRVFGSAATTGVNATTSTAGTNYVFRVMIVDSYGNSTPTVSSGRAVVPFDQTKATLSGGTDISTTAAYLGKYRRQSATTNYAKVTLVGNRLQVIGLRCSSCGSFDVFEGSTRIATISSYTTGTTVYRAVLFTKTYSSVGTHTWIIRPKATSGHPYVMLDAFAARR